MSTGIEVQVKNEDRTNTIGHLYLLVDTVTTIAAKTVTSRHDEPSYHKLNCYPLTCGVPQGAVLSPILFSIHTADVVGKNYRKATVGAYADDIAIYSSSMNAEATLHQAEAVCSEIVQTLGYLNISVNATKTDCVEFARTKHKRSRLSKTLYMNNTVSSPSNSNVYLGVKVDRHLKLYPSISEGENSCTVTDFLTSGHRPVIYEIYGKSPEPGTEKFNYREADWSRFKEEIYHRLMEIPALHTVEKVDTNIDQFTAAIVEAAKPAIPTYHPRAPHLQKPPPHIMALIRSRNASRSKLHVRLS
nr:uncharacterized protein LOC106689210 [Halyomorpha halys]